MPDCGHVDYTGGYKELNLTYQVLHLEFKWRNSFSSQTTKCDTCRHVKLQVCSLKKELLWPLWPAQPAVNRGICLDHVRQMTNTISFNTLKSTHTIHNCWFRLKLIAHHTWVISSNAWQLPESTINSSQTAIERIGQLRLKQMRSPAIQAVNNPVSTWADFFPISPSNLCFPPQMPVKWMALECIHYRKFTHQSDVWSYGECRGAKWIIHLYSCQSSICSHPWAK